MMRKSETRTALLYLAAAVFLACHLAKTVDCYRLKKTERRRGGRKEFNIGKTKGIQEGRIVFGIGLEAGSRLESQVVDRTSNASVTDKSTFQADFAGNV